MVESAEQLAAIDESQSFTPSSHCDQALTCAANNGQGREDVSKRSHCDAGGSLTRLTAGISLSILVNLMLWTYLMSTDAIARA